MTNLGQPVHQPIVVGEAVALAGDLVGIALEGGDLKVKTLL